ncbi:MAG: peptidase domain protein [Acidobacteria bacterium]|nr:peptidase domain protein [Acidobacteriota bacterium]
MKRTGTMFTLALSTVLSTLLAPAAFAQTAPAVEAPPPAAPAKDFSVPEVRRFTLPNGLRVRLVPYGTIPKVDVQLFVQTGRADESANEIWLSNLTGEMMQQGTATRSAEEIARAAAGMGGSLDVGVGTNQTTIGGSVLSESGPGLVELIADVARHPAFPATELKRLQGDLVRDLSLTRAQQQSLAQEKFNKTLFAGSPYGHGFPTAEAIQGYTLDQVRAFHERNFGAARARLYVTGRFDPVAMEAAIRSRFGDWQRGSAAATLDVKPAANGGLYLIDRPGAVQSTVYIGLPTIGPESDDAIALSVMNALLGGSFNSRITSNIREQKGYTYSPNSSVTQRPRATSWAEVADVTTNVTGPSIKEIIGEIERLRGAAPTAQELKGIQNYLAGTFVLRNSNRAGIINQLAFIDLYGLPENYLQTYVGRVYAATPETIRQMAQRYIDPSKLTIVVAGDKKVIAEQLKPFGTVVE